MSKNNENKTENNTPNVKNIKKYLPKLLKSVIGFDKINDVVKDSKGKTVQVNASSSTFNYPNTFYTGYNDKGEAVAVLKQGTDYEKKPFTYVLCEDPNGKHHFSIGAVGYDLTIRPNDTKPVLDEYKNDFAVEVHNNGNKQTPDVNIRDFKGRLVFSQNSKGDYTTYTYLQDTCAVTDYAKTEVNVRLCKDNKNVQINELTQTVVHYEYKEHNDRYNGIVPKYACETENGVLVKEFFFEMDSVGSFVHVIDYKNNEEYWRERDLNHKYPEQGNAHPTNFFVMGGLKFVNKDEYEAYRNNKIDEMKVEAKAREMFMGCRPPMMMCGPCNPFMG